MYSSVYTSGLRSDPHSHITSLQIIESREITQLLLTF